MEGLDDLLAAVGLQSERNTAVAAQVTGNYAQLQDINNSRATMAAKVGEDDSIISSQKEAGELKAQQNARTFATSAGTNMDDTSEIMSALGMQLKSASVEAIRAQKVVQDKSSVKLLDDPLQYIMNSVTIGDDINYANQAAETADTISQSLAKLNSATQQTTLTQNAIAQTKTAATVEATADEVHQKALDQAAQIKQNNVLYNIQGIKEANALDQTTLSNGFSAQNAIVANKHLEIAQAQLAEQMWLHRQELEKKLKEDAFDQDTADTINKGRSIQGLPSIPAGKALQLIKMGGDLGDQIRGQYESGAVSQTTGLNVISENPGKAAFTIASSGAPLASSMKPVRDLMVGAVSDVTSGKVLDKNNQPINLKDKGAIINATAAHINQLADTQAKLIKPGDNSNIYQAPDINSVIKIVPSVQQTPMYKTVLAPLVQTGLKDINPDQIVSLTATAVKNGALNFQDASTGIAALFSAAKTTNNVTKDYIRVGIKPQTSYIAPVHVITEGAPNLNLLNTNLSITTNLTDVNAVNRLISQKLANMTVESGYNSGSFLNGKGQ